MFGLLGAALGAAGGIGQSAWSAAEAAKQRRWQRRMRQTAYQDTMQDMVKAGLNPILAYQRGPSGIGSGATANIANLGGAMAAGAQAGSAKALKKKQEDLVDAQIQTEVEKKQREMEHTQLLNEQTHMARYDRMLKSARNAFYYRRKDGLPTQQGADAIWWQEMSARNNSLIGGIKGVAQALPIGRAASYMKGAASAKAAAKSVGRTPFVPRTYRAPKGHIGGYTGDR